VTAPERATGTGTGSFAPVVLIGPPGAGKTTVGTLLATLLGVGFADTDALVEAVAGKPVGDIFVTDGEPAFRRLEREAVAAALAGADQMSVGSPSGQPDASGAGVVALGGGAVMDDQTQALLAGRRMVYLETGFAQLAKRVGLDRARPLLIGTNPRAQLKALLEQRLPVYDKLAWLTVSTDDREPAEIAADIAAQIAEIGGDAPGEHR
jgi:shikimate kinase